MIHTEKIIADTIKILRKLREEQGVPVHALLHGKWGVGKTVSAKKIAKSIKDTFYIKVQDGITRNRLLKSIGFAIGCGARHSYEATLDLIKAHLEYLNMQPILIIDESQRIFSNQQILNELKDLAEDESVSLCYVFLGDQTTAQIIASHPHSIHARIVVRKELHPIDINTVEKLIQGNLKVDAEKLYNFGKSRNWTTLDFQLVIQALKNTQTQSEIDEDVLTKVAAVLGR